MQKSAWVIAAVAAIGCGSMDRGTGDLAAEAAETVLEGVATAGASATEDAARKLAAGEPLGWEDAGMAAGGGIVAGVLLEMLRRWRRDKKAS